MDHPPEPRPTATIARATRAALIVLAIAAVAAVTAGCTRGGGEPPEPEPITHVDPDATIEKAAATGDLVLEIGHGAHVHEVAGYSPDADRSLEGIIESFGDPGSRKVATNGELVSCDVRWPKLGAAALLTGPDEESACERVTAFNLYGERWRTDRGLSIGDPVEKARELYDVSGEDERKGGIILIGFGDLEDLPDDAPNFPVLEAQVEDDRVKMLRVSVL